MSQMRGDSKGSSNNINININLSMKDRNKPVGKKIENNIKIGTTAMETKRLTLMTQRLKDKKREIEGHPFEQEEGDLVGARFVGLTTKKQRSKTMRLGPEQTPSAFSTTKTKSKFVSRDVKEVRQTPVKISNTKQEDLFSKQKRTFSSERIKSRRNSTRGGNSAQNLKKTKVHKSPSKSQGKSGSRSASKSSTKHKAGQFKKKEKPKLEIPKSAEKHKTPKEGLKSHRAKSRVSFKAKDDVYINKPPVKKAIKGKSIISSTIDVPDRASYQKAHKRKSSLTLVPKPFDKNYKQHSPDVSVNKYKSAITIQKLWRGYKTRKQILSALDSLRNKHIRVKANIAGNRREFWGDNSLNSIIYVDVSIQDSFTEGEDRPPVQLFSGQEVMSIQGSTEELNSFDRLIKISQKVGDEKLARQLREMAENIMREDLEKRRIMRQNRQLKQDLVQLKEESINHPYVEPVEQKEEDSGIRMPVRIQKVQPMNQFQSPKVQEAAVEYHSAKQELSPQEAQEKKRLIEQLRSFKGESDSLMKKIQKGSSDVKIQQKSPPKVESSDGKKQPKKEEDIKIPRKLQKPCVIEPYISDNDDEQFQDFGEAIKKSESEFGNKGGLQFLKDTDEKQVDQKQIVNKLPVDTHQIINMFPGQPSDVRQYSEDSEQNDRQQRQGQLQSQPREKKGFQTNLNFVKQYCIGLCEYIRGNESIKNKFKQEILKPLRLDTVSLLKSYRNTIDGEYNGEYNSFKSQYVYPYYKESIGVEGLIEKSTFDSFNETLTTLKRNIPDSDLGQIQLEAAHLLSLLEVFNESLNYERPSGVYGEALPWAPNVRHLKNINSTFQDKDQSSDGEYSKENQKFDQLFGVSIARVIQWGSSLCGFIPESLDMQTGIQIDQEYINHIKETRMALMLQKTLAQDQEKMLEFTDVETEVKMEIGLRVFDDLLDQVLQQAKLREAAGNFQYI